MKIDDMIKELRELRDEATCTDEHCLCERYDRIIDALEAQRAWIWNWLKMNSDPTHSDGEGLAMIPQVIPDDYISDGEFLDYVLEWFEESMGLSIDTAALEMDLKDAIEYHREQFAIQLEGDDENES